ncbi:MAG: hypothetical protein IJ222_06960 [Bacteroidales bacterium]|nr:hypothetical protein [Bacteroidales bacterium]
MIEICGKHIALSLHEPGDGYYLGTRFDHAGVFAGVRKDGGPNLAEEWFESYSPTMHDAVCGPAEEFSPIGPDRKGERFLKIGVGLLENPFDAPYDRFRLYPLADAGSRETTVSGSGCSFFHSIDTPEGWAYRYTKTISVHDSGFEILHELRNTGRKPLKGDTYNHNFFTFGKLQTGPAREIHFGFEPVGKWRARYDSVALEGRSLVFSRALLKGESVYMGDIGLSTDDGPARAPYSFTIRESGQHIEIEGDAPVSKAVFWANHRIACIEPYVGFDIAPGETFRYKLKYSL